jgi:hypothetical protein
MKKLVFVTLSMLVCPLSLFASQEAQPEYVIFCPSTELHEVILQKAHFVSTVNGKLILDQIVKGKRTRVAEIDADCSIGLNTSFKSQTPPAAIKLQELE